MAKTRKKATLPSAQDAPANAVVEAPREVTEDEFIANVRAGRETNDAYEDKYGKAFPA